MWFTVGTGESLGVNTLGIRCPSVRGCICASVCGAHIHPRCVIPGCRASTLLGAEQPGLSCWRAWPEAKGMDRGA